MTLCTYPSCIETTNTVDLSLGVALVINSLIPLNNAGQVIAVGVIPEPEIYAMLLAGLGQVGFMVQRKKIGGETFSLG
jgi:hypothetical protein